MDFNVSQLCCCSSVQMNEQFIRVRSVRGRAKITKFPQKLGHSLNKSFSNNIRYSRKNLRLLGVTIQKRNVNVIFKKEIYFKKPREMPNLLGKPQCK